MFNKKAYFNIRVVLLILLFSCFVQSSIAHHLVPFKNEFTKGKYGYWDTLMKRPFIYWHFNEANYFQDNGLAWVKAGSRWGMIDTLGNIILPIEFKSTHYKWEGDTLRTGTKARDVYFVRKESGYQRMRKDKEIYEPEMPFTVPLTNIS